MDFIIEWQKIFDIRSSTGIPFPLYGCPLPFNFEASHGGNGTFLIQMLYWKISRSYRLEKIVSKISPNWNSGRN